MPAAPPSLVHEADAQRQHLRVRIPGSVLLEAGDGRLRLQLLDLSSGGIGFRAQGTTLKAGQRCVGRVQLDVDGLALAIPVRFRVRHFDAASGRGGGQFESLEATEIATVRRIVTAALSGELIGVDDVLHTLSRNNYTAPRKPATTHPEPTRLARMRAFSLTTLIVLLGVAALVYAGVRIDERLFGAQSSAARVGGPNFTVAMPRDGVFRSLVPDDGLLRKGAALGSFETSMLDLVRGQAADAGLDGAALDALLQRSVKGTITSPCDCRVQALLAADGQYVGKGQSLAELVPLDFEPHVIARFRYPQAERIQPGMPVTLRISGDHRTHGGRITQLRYGDNDVLTDHVIAIVQPDQSLDKSLLSHRAEVNARDGRLFGLLSGLVGPANAGPQERSP